MKDFLGQTLEIDDDVIIIAPSYRHFVKAKVIKFTPQQVRVAYNNTWNYASEGMYTELLQSPQQVVRLPYSG